MEEQLKIRKLASVSVRRQRIAERQKQKELLAEQREERRKRMLRYSEIYSTDSNESRSNSPENDSSTETPSEYSVHTPKDSLSLDAVVKIQASDLVLEIATKEETLLDRRRSRLRAKFPAPIMLAPSLRRPCDFRYDRFSTVLDPVDIESSEGETSSSSENEEDDEDYSPIEVATPVSFHMPVTRPNIISVVDQRPRKFLVKHIDTSMVTTSNSAPVTPISSVSAPAQKPYNSTESDPSKIYPAGLSTLSSASLISVDTLSENTRTLSHEPRPNSALKRTSTMPILTRLAHARMNSIKHFMKPQSVSESLPAVPQIPSTLQRRPSENASSILFPSPPSSLSSYRSKNSYSDRSLSSSPPESVIESAAQLKTTMQDIRPQTAHRPSQTSTLTLDHDSMQVQLPALLDIEGERLAMTRKKSFAALRRRSISLGQALKVSGSRSKSPVPDAPLPPMPTTAAAARESVMSLELSTSSTKTSKKSRKSVYSPFPPSDQKISPVGLGLRM